MLQPPIGNLLDRCGVRMTHLQYEVQPATRDKQAVVVRYGLFLQAILEFTGVSLIAFVLFQVATRNASA